MMLTGCTAEQRPRTLAPTQRAAIRSANPAITVGIERGSPHVADLLTVLNGTKMFRRVAYIDEFSGSPDLLATTVKPLKLYSPGGPGPPFFTVLTFGVIPDTDDELYEFSFTLTSVR